MIWGRGRYSNNCQARFGYEEIDSQEVEAELDMKMSYSTNLSRIIVLLKRLRNIDKSFRLSSWSNQTVRDRGLHFARVARLSITLHIVPIP